MQKRYKIFLEIIFLSCFILCCQKTKEVVLISPSFTPLPTETLNPSNTPKPTRTRQPLPTDTPIPIATISTIEPLVVCSPLVPYTLAELPEIISDPYHPPPEGRDERHHGIDFSHYRRGNLLTIEGVEVQAIYPGKVTYSEENSWPYGNVLMIETPAKYIPVELQEKIGLSVDESLYILYAHLLEPPTYVLGDPVKSCQILNKVGKSGNTVQPHLHLETRLGPSGAEFQSMRFYQTDATPEQQAAYQLWRTSGHFRHFDPMLLLQP